MQLENRFIIERTLAFKNNKETESLVELCDTDEEDNNKGCDVATPFRSLNIR